MSPLFFVPCSEHQDAYEFFTRLQDIIDEHLRAVGRPRAIHAAMGGTFAQVGGRRVSLLHSAHSGWCLGQALAAQWPAY